MPKRGSKVMFKNHRRQLPAQFVIYADFESLLIPVKEEGGCLRKTQSHELCSYDSRECVIIIGRMMVNIGVTGELALEGNSWMHC
jgi:hypothetical protein